MPTRNCRLELRLTKSELTDLTRKARKARLTNSAFIRRAIREQEVKEAPPVDVPILIREVKRVGCNLDQLLRVANAQGLMDVPLLQKTLYPPDALVQGFDQSLHPNEDCAANRFLPFPTQNTLPGRR